MMRYSAVPQRENRTKVLQIITSVLRTVSSDLSCGTTLGWYKTDKKRSEIIQDDTGRESLIKEALLHFKAQGHDFAQYDNDNDGFIDYFMVLWAGPDNGWANFWWGYQTGFSDPGFRIDGKALQAYSWQWECRPVGSKFNTRVVIHETGHALGLPDLYDYDESTGPDGGSRWRRYDGCKPV